MRDVLHSRATLTTLSSMTRRIQTHADENDAQRLQRDCEFARCNIRVDVEHAARRPALVHSYRSEHRNAPCSDGGLDTGRVDARDFTN